MVDRASGVMKMHRILSWFAIIAAIASAATAQSAHEILVQGIKIIQRADTPITYELDRLDNDRDLGFIAAAAVNLGLPLQRTYAQIGVAHLTDDGRTRGTERTGFFRTPAGFSICRFENSLQNLGGGTLLARLVRTADRDGIAYRMVVPATKSSELKGSGVYGSIDLSFVRKQKDVWSKYEERCDPHNTIITCENEGWCKSRLCEGAECTD